MLDLLSDEPVQSVESDDDGWYYWKPDYPLPGPLMREGANFAHDPDDLVFEAS